MKATVHQPTAPRYSTLELDQERRLTPGSVILGGRLEIIAELARGGTSIVYHAIDHLDADRHVALKIVNAGANPAMTETRFHNEVHLMKRLAGHPHVVPALATGHLDGPPDFAGRCYLLTQLIDGVALDRVMGDHRLGLDWRRACTVARDAARALVALHERGIVHRDIKPGNVLLSYGGAERALLVDFGMAHRTDEGWKVHATDLGHRGRAGTLLYMPPEQVAHAPPSPSMDVYSFGIMLYELLSGNPPYHKLTADEIVTRKFDRERQPFPLARLCPELDTRITTLVDRCLRHEPDARPAAKELLDTLDGVLGHDAPTIARPEPPLVSTLDPAMMQLPALLAGPVPTPLPAMPSRRRPRDVAVAVGLTLSGVVLGVLARVFVLGGDPTEREDPAVSVAAPEGPPSSSDSLVTSAGAHDAPRPPTTTTPISGGPELVEVGAPTNAPMPERPKPKRWPEECTETLTAARHAVEGRDWIRVLELTKRDTCWRPQATEERVGLRTRALFETLRYRECAMTGKRATAPDVVRWAHICAGKSRGGSP